VLPTGSDPIALVPVLGATLSIVYKILSEYKRKSRKSEETIEERVQTLTRSLHEATRLVGSIETEIKTRSALATQLQKDIEQYNQLVQMKKPKVEAVAQLLRGELQKENRGVILEEHCCEFHLLYIGIRRILGNQYYDKVVL
jgi:hypothetical protein